MRSCITRLGIAAAALGVAAAAWAAAETGTIAGTVRRSNGPVASARVEIDSGADSKFSASATTDHEGQFTVPDVPVGPVGIKVYDATSHVLAQTRATVTHAGERVSLVVQVP
jgi:hypothetical protein